jgi:type II secretory pathway component GspD/PulD (secretin)
MKYSQDKCLSVVMLLSLLCSTSVGQEVPTGTVATTERRITLNIAKGEIGDALRLVAEQGGLNLVIGPEVKGHVSVYLTDASLTSALKAIAVNNGFEYTVDDGVIAVSKPPPKPEGPEPPPPMVTRIFNLQSQDAERVRDALEFAMSKYGRIKVLNQNSQLGYGIQRLSSLAGEITSANGSANNTTTVSTTNNASMTSNGQPGMSGNSTFGPGGGTQMLDQARGSRTLVVTDTEENVDRVAELIADLDKLPPQVLIEARIVEMSTDLQRQLGIDWNVNALATGPILNHEWPLRNRAGFASGTQIRRSPDGTAEASAGLALGTIDFSQFTALLQANQNDTAIRLLANPRLLVYNNHSASILVGERYPILRANITDFGTVTEAFDTYIPVGVQLEVTPTIMRDGTISLLVHPATSSLGDDVVGTTGLHVARILTREIDTRILMQDGQTIVLGGLISDRKTRSIEKVPGLGDLPILDIFFRSESPQVQRTDLLIFLTANIEGAIEISERDHQVFDMYKPVFKHVDRLQDVQLHFEIPTEFEWPKPMFSDPPACEDEEASDSTVSAGESTSMGSRSKVERTERVRRQTIEDAPRKVVDQPPAAPQPKVQSAVEEAPPKSEVQAAPEPVEESEESDSSDESAQQTESAVLGAASTPVAAAPSPVAPQLLTVAVAQRTTKPSLATTIWNWLKTKLIESRSAVMKTIAFAKSMEHQPGPARQALVNSGASLDE